MTTTQSRKRITEWQIQDHLTRRLRTDLAGRWTERLGTDFDLVIERVSEEVVEMIDRHLRSQTDYNDGYRNGKREGIAEGKTIAAEAMRKIIKDLTEDEPVATQ